MKIMSSALLYQGYWLMLRELCKNVIIKAKLSEPVPCLCTLFVWSKLGTVFSKFQTSCVCIFFFLITGLDKMREMILHAAQLVSMAIIMNTKRKCLGPVFYVSLLCNNWVKNESNISWKIWLSFPIHLTTMYSFLVSTIVCEFRWHASCCEEDCK